MEIDCERTHFHSWQFRESAVAIIQGVSVPTGIGEVAPRLVLFWASLKVIYSWIIGEFERELASSALLKRIRVGTDRGGPDQPKQEISHEAKFKFAT